MTTDFSGSELVNIEIQLQNKEDVFCKDYQKAMLNIIGRRNARRNRRANRAI